MRKQLRTKIGALCAAIVLGYSANSSAFVIDTCMVAGAGCTVGVTPTQGWDGAGLGSFNLGYYIGNPSRADQGLAGLTVSSIETAFLAAAATWSSVAQVSFTKRGDVTISDVGFNSNFTNSIVVYFHGSGADAADGIGFDGVWSPSAGTGSVFAHAWGPSDIMTEGTAGNIHLDKDELWVTAGAETPPSGISATIDLQTVLLHEIGHSLGLGHENSLGSGLTAPVMQSLYWGEQRSLRADDIAGIRTLYACAGQGCPTDPGNGDGNGNVPEPSTLLLLGLGLVAWRGVSRRQTRP